MKQIKLKSNILLIILCILISLYMPIQSFATNSNSVSYEIGDIVKFGKYEQDNNEGNGKEDKGFREYAYDGIVFEDWIGGGAYPPNHPRLLNWRSTRVQSVRVTGKDIISDAGVKIGMTGADMIKALRSKYVRKSEYPKGDPFESRGQSLNTPGVIMGYSMQDTLPFNLFCTFKDGKLTRYSIAPH